MVRGAEAGGSHTFRPSLCPSQRLKERRGRGDRGCGMSIVQTMDTYSRLLDDIEADALGGIDEACAATRR